MSRLARILPALVALLCIAIACGCSDQQEPTVIKADQETLEAEAQYMKDYAKEQEEGY